ncbi:hypothetical protein NC653_037410 [Populus alba x Populus x berolinensis]|uniref:Uncharacterized protein n=1 Tax=Populus alba x Populus x berolinensis TaxID=444605 RepID=A0AAD6LFY2_9ROSI|nr:hypothetical protein NC653_037410 [Populus alba x Populus x berolinensis]
MYKEDKFEGGFGVLLLILECGSDHRGFVYHKFLDVILLDCPCYSQKGGAGLKKNPFSSKEMWMGYWAWPRAQIDSVTPFDDSLRNSLLEDPLNFF